MLSSPLGPHILSYKPLRGFVMPSFSMYDGSTDPYDHMLHFNQTMILSAGNHRLLCKVFPASLKGPVLAWFQKLPRGSISLFSELWATFISYYLCSVRQKGNISLLQAILKREDESIRDHPDFKWPPPMRASPDQPNRSLRCDYHRDHDHETNRCQSLKFMVEKLIQARHLRRYIQEPTRGIKTAPAADRAIAGAEHSSEPRPTINFILGGPTDDQYQFKRQRRKMLCATSIRARINTISTPESGAVIQPVDDLISFFLINPNKVITPHYDALVLTLCINNFDVHRVLIDPGSVADLLHLPAFQQMKVPLDHLSSAGRILSGFNGATTLMVGDIILSVKAGPVTQQVLFSVVKDLGPCNAIMGTL